MSEQQILQASLKLFARYGYDYVSVRRIAGEANVNIGSISYYFHNKIGILERIVDDFYKGLYMAVDPVFEDPNLKCKKDSIRKLAQNCLEYMYNQYDASRIVAREITLDTERFDGIVGPHNIHISNKMIDFFERLEMNSPRRAAIKFMALIRFPFSNGNILKHYYEKPFEPEFFEDYTHIVLSSLSSELSA